MQNAFVKEVNNNEDLMCVWDKMWALVQKIVCALKQN